MLKIQNAFVNFQDAVQPECEAEISQASYFAGALTAILLLQAGTSPEDLIAEITRYGCDCSTVAKH